MDLQGESGSRVILVEAKDYIKYFMCFHGNIFKRVFEVKSETSYLETKFLKIFNNLRITQKCFSLYRTIFFRRNKDIKPMKPSVDASSSKYSLLFIVIKSYY